MAYTTITDPSVYFQTALYSGNGGGTNNVVNDGNSNLQPDWVWVKERTATSSHALTNSTVGAGYILSSNNTNAQSSASAFTSFDSDGFTVGSDGKTNEVNQTYVGWQWKANGGTTVTNNAGSLSSTVQANTTAGFSVVKWTSDGNNGRTVGHGLGVKPTVIITKNISAQGSWYSFFEAAGVDKYLRINSTDAATTNTDIFGGGAQATSVFTIGQSTAGYSNGNDIIAYVFAPIQGYSSFGSYTGNNNADGAFVYTGFKPAWLLIKNYTSSGNGWTLTDNARSPVNEATKYLLANTNDSEGTGVKIDLLSNGFKLRATTQNESQSYIYLAFAENPFTTSDGVPTTAR